MVRQNNALKAESGVHRELVPCLIDGDALVIDLGNGNSKVTVENGQGVKISKDKLEVNHAVLSRQFRAG